VFTVGIGNGCSSYLVKRLAEAGNGKFELIPDNGDIEGKIVNLLKKSFSPSITNFDIKFDDKKVDILAPRPNKNDHI